MPATIERSIPCHDALTGEWYEQLRKEVDYRCSFCDVVQTDINEMEAKVRQAYATTAQSLRGIYDINEIVKRWYGMLAFSTEVLEHARFRQQTNQICGIDLAVFLEFQTAAFNRLALHCPEIVDACETAEA